MRAGSLAPIGNAVGSLSPSASTIPASDRLCDVVVVLFALWTVCANAVVAAGRGLWALLALYAIVLIAYRLVKRRMRPAAALPAEATGDATIDSPRTFGLLRVAAVAAGVAATLTFVVQENATALWWSAVILLGLAAVVICFGAPPRIAPPEQSRSSETLLWLLAGLAVVITLVSHRPDADDAFYINVAVSAADAPQRPLLGGDTMHGIPGLPLTLPVYRVHSYELFNGALAYLTGIPAIYCFHWLSAACAALLVPLAYAKLFRILTPRRWLATVATLLFVLVAAGEVHRWYGNFAFVRMWQGKSIVLSVFMPLVYAYALRFGVRPNLRDWMLLMAAQIAAVGASSSALWVAPLGATMALCCAVRPSRRAVTVVLLGMLASVYVLVAASLVRTSLDGRFAGAAIASPEGVVDAPPVQSAAVAILGDSRLLVFGIASLLTGWAFAPAGLARRFAVVFPLAVAVGLLNPYLASWVAANITGPSYWRSMWALPLPIIMTMVLTAPLDLGRGRSGQWIGRAVWLGLLAAFALFVPRFSGLSAANGVALGWPRLKVPAAPFEWAAVVNASVPRRSHVAVASDIATWMVTRHHHAYPLLVRHYLHIAKGVLEPRELFERAAMQRFLDSPELVEATPEQFRNDLDRFQIRAVCLVSSPRAGAARAILQQAHFRPTLRSDDYELWVRTEPGVAPPLL